MKPAQLSFGVLLFVASTFSTAATFPAALTNASARVTLPTGGSTTIGFVVTNSGNYLVRAAGPSLAAFGVAHPAGHPTITLYAGSNPIARNSHWASTGDAAASDVASIGGWLDLSRRLWILGKAALAVGAFDLDDNDSAMLVHLEPGAYTATVTNTGSAGDALVEIYAAPSGPVTD